MERSKGQILPLVLFSIVISAVLMVVMFNATQKVTDKTIATNASDAAVYSGGVWVARQLNFMAYTNRAMIANHVAAGHMVAYVSWSRYVNDSVANLNKIARFIPYLNSVMAALEQYAGVNKQLAEASAQVLIPSIDALNRLHSLAQRQAWLALRPSKVEEVMRTVLVGYDSDLRLNITSELSGEAAKNYKPLIDFSIASYRSALVGAAEILGPGADGGEMKGMVERSYAGSERWLNNRNWSQSLVLFKLRKESSTSHDLQESLGEWQAEDRLRYGRWTPKGWKWSTIGRGEASSDEFMSNYKGIHSYARKRGSAERELTIDLVALATKFDTQTVSRTRMGIDSKGTVISGYSKSRVYFERPLTGFDSTASEYANLYNPFWKVKLVEAWP